jgi:hypothetical protein
VITGTALPAVAVLQWFREEQIVLTWPRTDISTIRAGGIAGIAACLAYALLAIHRLPLPAVVMLAAVFGPAFCIGSYGLRRLLSLDGARDFGSLAFALNAVAAGIFTVMVMVQLAFAQPGAPVPHETRVLWLGLDVAWDVYLFCGTVCFALGMLRHPRFGVVFAVSGILVAAALMTLHLVTFPWPPQNRGLIDLGPAVGLWYLAVSVQTLRSIAWVREHEYAGAITVA